MNRKEVYSDIEQVFGIVPSFFKSVPDSVLEMEWNLFKKTQLEESPIPAKYKELIGLGIASATKCRYCTFYHTEAAKMFGATEEEIQDALLFAKANTGWSTFINGTQQDFEQFRQEILDSIEYAKQHMQQEVNTN
jgi:AhpD family alkylhydroperoxidase